MEKLSRLMKKVEIDVIEVSDFITEGCSKHDIIEYFNKFGNDILFCVRSDWGGHTIQTYYITPETDEEYEKRVKAEKAKVAKKLEQIHKLASDIGVTVTIKDK